MAKRKGARTSAQAARRAPAAGGGPGRQPQGAGGRPQGVRRDLAWAAGLVLLAWVHRLVFLHSNRDLSWPFTFFYEGDSEAFFRYARALLAGELYDSGLPFHPPGFAWLLAAVHVLVGAGERAARVPHAAVKSVLALLGSLPVGLLYLLARSYLGRTAALLGAVLCVHHFGLYVLAVAPVSESLYLALLLACLLLWSRLGHPLAAPGRHPLAAPGRHPLAAPGRHPLTAPGGLPLTAPEGRAAGRAGAFVLGLLLGALALTRAEGALVGALLGAAGLGGALWSRREERQGRRNWRQALVPWLLAAAGWTVLVAPWTARNAVRVGEYNRGQGSALAEPLPTFVPLTLYGPINLALANNPGAQGGFSREALASGAGAPVLDLGDPEHLRFFLHGDEMAREWIAAHPGDFALLVARKWGLFLGAWRLGWTQWDWPGGLKGVRRPVDVFVPDSGAALWLAPPLVLLGLALCLKTPGGPRRWAVLVLLLAAAGFATTALFFGYARLGLLLVPFGLTLAGAALAWLGESVARHKERGRRHFALEPADPPRRLLLALGVAAALLLALELWGATTDRNFRATGSGVGAHINRDEAVYLEPIPR